MAKESICTNCKRQKLNDFRVPYCGLTKENPGFVEECADYIDIDSDIIIEDLVSAEFGDDSSEYSEENKSVYPILENIISNYERAKAVQVVLWIFLLITFISLYSDILEYNLLTLIDSGADFDISEAETNDTRQLIIGIVYLITYFFSAVLFLRWFKRGYENLRNRIPAVKHSSGWTIGAWFVPFINVVRPYCMMKEMWIESAKLIYGQTYNLVQNKKIIISWWTLWIISGIAGRVLWKQSMRAETIGEILRSTQISVIAGGLDVLLTIITIMMIRKYSQMESKLEEIETGKSSFRY